MKKILTFALCGLLVFSSCGNMSNLGKGAIFGTAGGAVLGAGIGAIIGGEKGAAIGAAAGAAVGAGTGAVIGDIMDRKAEELAKIENAKVEQIVDINGLPAIKVTFDSGILFDFNKSDLNETAMTDLKTFSDDMSDMTDALITVWGHTDNVGSESANAKVSQKRADAVTKQLIANGIDKGRIVSEGKSFNIPVATNDTEEGRAQNRRVEIYVSATEEMVKAVEEAAKAAEATE